MLWQLLLSKYIVCSHLQGIAKLYSYYRIKSFTKNKFYTKMCFLRSIFFLSMGYCIITCCWKIFMKCQKPISVHSAFHNNMYLLSTHCEYRTVLYAIALCRVHRRQFLNLRNLSPVLAGEGHVYIQKEKERKKKNKYNVNECKQWLLHWKKCYEIAFSNTRM